MTKSYNNNKLTVVSVEVGLVTATCTGPILLAMGQICSQHKGHVKGKTTILVATLLPKITPMPPQSFTKTRKDADNFRLECPIK